MAILATGNTFSDGDQVTSTKLNNSVNNATFASGAVDDSTTSLSSGAIIVKDGGISPSKLSTGAPHWTSGGNLGIGTTSPGAELEVTTGNDGTVPTLSAGTGFILNNTNSGAAGMAILANTNCNLFFGDSTDENKATIQYSVSNDEFLFTTASSGINNVLSVGSGGSAFVGIGVATATDHLDINGDAIRLRNTQTPSSASDTGAKGTITWDASYIYVCTSTNTWKRAALSTW